jgi:hypothetical protein
VQPIRAVVAGTRDASANAMLSCADQRRHSRFDGSQLSALLTFDGAAHPEAHIENVSMGGALVTLVCAPPASKRVQLALWRMGRHALKLAGRVLGVVPARPGHPEPRLRIGFLRASLEVTAQLYAMIRDLPAEIGEQDLLPAVAPAPADDEPALALVNVVDDEAKVRMAMERDLLSKQLRIEELERQLRRMLRGARSLESLLLFAS